MTGGKPEDRAGLRIGFLFNHYAPHQVPHAAPYAFELSRRHPQFEIHIACATKEEMAIAQRIARLYPGQGCYFKELRLSPLQRLLDPYVENRRFHRKKKILRQNLAFFRSLDALVAPERNCLKLRESFGLERLRMI